MLHRLKAVIPVVWPLLLLTSTGSRHHRFLGAIALAFFASAPAFSSDVPGLTCSQIGSFARKVAEQKLNGGHTEGRGSSLTKMHRVPVRGAEGELGKIVRGIYRIPTLSTVSPEEVGSAYQIACESGQSRAQITALGKGTHVARKQSSRTPSDRCPAPTGYLRLPATGKKRQHRDAS